MLITSVVLLMQGNKSLSFVVTGIGLSVKIQSEKMNQESLQKKLWIIFLVKDIPYTALSHPHKQVCVQSEILPLLLL